LKFTNESGIWFCVRVEKSEKTNSIQNNTLFFSFSFLGLGTKLMQWAEQEARKANCHTIALDVAATNPRAAALYERVGYSIVKKSNLCCLSLCLTHSKFYHMRKPLKSAEPLLLPRQSAAI